MMKERRSVADEEARRRTYRVKVSFQSGLRLFFFTVDLAVRPPHASLQYGSR